MKTATLTQEIKARRIAAEISNSTGWMVETWAIHPTGNPGASVAQVQIYRHEGRWYYWSGASIVRQSRVFGEMLAEKRNQKA